MNRKPRKAGQDRIAAGFGLPCKSCRQPLRRWERPPGWQPQQGRGYYAYWFECRNSRCKVQQVMPPEAYRGEKAPPVPQKTAPRAVPPAPMKKALEVRLAFESREGIEANEWHAMVHMEVPYSERSATRLLWTRDCHVRFLEKNADLRDFDPAAVAWTESCIEAIDAELVKLGQRPPPKPAGWRRPPDPARAPHIAKAVREFNRDGVRWVELDHHRGAALFEGRFAQLWFVDSHPGRVFYASLRETYSADLIGRVLIYSCVEARSAARRPGGLERLIRNKAAFHHRKEVAEEARRARRRRYVDYDALNAARNIGRWDDV